MRIHRNLRHSIRALGIHRARTTLAIITAATGVAAVIVLTSVGGGARGEIMARIEALGRTTLVITPERVEPRAGRRRQGASLALTLRTEDASAIAHASLAVRRTAPVHNREMTANYRRIETPVTVIATTPDWLDIRRFTLAGGRNFTSAENRTRARVAILGSQVRAAMFGDTADPAGRIIRVGSVPFVVIGWLNPTGSSLVGTGTEDDRIIVPLETGLRRLFDRDELRMIVVEAVSTDAMHNAMSDASTILRARHDLPSNAPDDFQIRDPVVLLAAELAASTSLQRLLYGLALLAGFVGGAGILSIMMLAVRERRNEIGLRVAVGARRRDIGLQFVTEAMIVAGAGGVVGTVAGMIGRAAVATFTEWTVTPPAGALATAATCILGLGLLAGVVPAVRASRQNPIAALRAPA